MNPTVTVEAPAAPGYEEIAVRAYFIHLSQPGAHELENWLRAERELTSPQPPEAPGPEAFDHPDLSRIRVNRAPVPSDFLEWKYSSRRVRDYLSQYTETSRVGSMQIRDSKLVLHSRFPARCLNLCCRHY